MNQNILTVCFDALPPLGCLPPRFNAHGYVTVDAWVQATPADRLGGFGVLSEPERQFSFAFPFDDRRPTLTPLPPDPRFALLRALWLCWQIEARVLLVHNSAEPVWRSPTYDGCVRGRVERNPRVGWLRKASDGCLELIGKHGGVRAVFPHEIAAVRVLTDTRQEPCLTAFQYPTYVPPELHLLDRPAGARPRFRICQGPQTLARVATRDPFRRLCWLYGATASDETAAGRRQQEYREAWQPPGPRAVRLRRL
jgi:hypothetical protein